jgi:uncharacterized membrane protein YgcG
MGEEPFMKSLVVRRALLPLLTLLLVSFARPVSAQEECINDVDCPGAECGGQVCQWLESGIQCMAAGSQPEGRDGWCTETSDCKCRGEGATCVPPYCTFVTSRSGSGGAVGSGGAGSGGTSGTSSGGTSGGSSGSAGSRPAPDDGESSGCAVGAPSGAQRPLAALFTVLLLAGLARRRRCG